MALSGTETLYVDGTSTTGGPAATTFLTTTGAIAALASSGGAGETINTAITTAGAGTLTGAAITGGVITRSGPVAAYSDTTDTAALIVAAIGAPFVGQSFYLRIKNTVNFTQTVLAGSGVTLSGSVVVPANSVATYLVTLTSLSAVTFLHIQTATLTNNIAEVVTALTTVGAGIITAAGIVGGVTTRGGAQSGSAFTDITDNATNIIAAQANAHVGVSWEYTYKNNTDAVATLTADTGVTLSVITVVPPNAQARFLVTYTAASTVTMVGISAGQMAADATDGTKVIAFKASGATTGTVSTIATTAAANAVYTLPPSTGVLAGTTGTNLFIPDVKKCTTQTDSITTVLANVTGLTAQTLVAGATYKFRCVLPGTADGTSGIKYAFKYTTATLTSIEATGIGNTASAVATQHTTTTTDATLLFDQAAAVIFVVLEGTAVINVGGTVALQIGTHTGTTTCSCYLGATMQWTRIA